MKQESDRQEGDDQDPIKIFYCYAREDKDLRDKLASHLEPLRQRGLIVTWYDREISAGKEWLREIYLHLDSSDIVLALVSPAFMYSAYCTDIVMQHARERQLIGSTCIVPVLLRYVSWKQTFLGELQALPRNGKPITDWRPVDRGFHEVAEGIEEVVHELRRTRIFRDQEASRRARDRGIDLFDLADKNPAYYEESLQYFQQSLRLDHYNMDSWAGLAYTLIQLGRLPDALIACNYFLHHKDEVDILALSVLRYKHHIFLAQDRNAEAEDIVREVVEHLTASLEDDKRFAYYLFGGDKEESLSGRVEERRLPRLAMDEQQQIFIQSSAIIRLQEK